MAHNDGIKLTIAKYYTPNGREIDGVGIQPDVEIKQDAKPQHIYALQTDDSTDAQLQTAEEILRHQVDAGKILFDENFWSTPEAVAQ